MDEAFPIDAEAYLGLIGGLMAERLRHPELIAAFREQILLPRRAIGRAAIEQALLARTFAGLDVGPRRRDRAFANWWATVRAPRTDRR